jgi:flavin reductase (DIM6/NTAB) family NADH-FMN oxidoreductase RutF
MRHEAKASSVSQKPKIEPELFRRTVGAFATGVAVITVGAGGATHAMTANAFMSGSFEPPLRVISIAKRAHTHEMIRHARRFGVNILGAGPGPVLRR